MKLKKHVDAPMNNEQGMVLVLVLLLLTALVILGTTAVMQTSTDLKISTNYRTSSQAFYIAEAGTSRAEAELINDLNTDQNIANTTFNQIAGPVTIAPSSTAFYTVLNNISFGTGAYTIEFKNYGTSPNFTAAAVLVRSTGTGLNSSTVILERYLAAENISPWNNAVFAGGGGGGAPITGNVVIAGSIHLLGTGLAATDNAFTNQTGDVRNSNTGMDDDLAAKVAGGTSSDLNSKFRIKNGRVDMTVGSSSIGSAASPFKGIYVTSGADAGGDGVNDDILGGDNSGAGRNLYANKGAGSSLPYDLGSNNITMPAINTAYMDAHSLDLGGPLALNTSNIPLQSGNFGGEDCSISFNAATKVLTIDGIVKVSSLTIGTDITYAGKGTLYVTGTTNIDGHVLPSAAASYPTTNVLGVVSTGNITLPTSAQKLLTGAFYTAGSATSSKQNELAGTIVCQNFNITAQVPKIWQVPSLTNNLPPGMPGAAPVWVVTEKTWRVN